MTPVQKTENEEGCYKFALTLLGAWMLGQLVGLIIWHFTPKHEYRCPPKSEICFNGHNLDHLDY